MPPSHAREQRPHPVHRTSWNRLGWIENLCMMRCRNCSVRVGGAAKAGRAGLAASPRRRSRSCSSTSKQGDAEQTAEQLPQPRHLGASERQTWWSKFRASHSGRRFTPDPALAATAGSIGPLCAGTLKFGVRWKTVTCFAWAAICGIDWMPQPARATPRTNAPVAGSLKSTNAFRPLAPGPVDGQIAFVTARMLEQYHYLRQPFDGTVSRKLLDRYVDLELAGHDADAAVPGLRAHLVGCPACREEYQSLRALVGDEPPVDVQAEWRRLWVVISPHFLAWPAPGDRATSNAS